MIKLTLTTCVILFLATGLQAAPIKKLQLSIDDQLTKFISTPIFKDGAWLVPLEPVCKQLGLKIDVPDGSDMVVLCGGEESELCVPLQFGEDAFSIDDVTYAKIESITEPFGFEIYKASETQFEIIRPEQLAPKFTLPDLDGTPKRLQDFRGKKTFLYIWGSW